MPRTKGLSAPRGRPKGKNTQPDSRASAECRVEGCKVTKRLDKLKDHYKISVMWREDGYPATPEEPGYNDLPKHRKEHTDWFRAHEFSSTKLPPTKRKNEPGPMDRFVQNKAKKSNVDDNSDPDVPDFGSEQSSDESEEMQFIHQSLSTFEDVNSRNQNKTADVNDSDEDDDRRGGERSAGIDLAALLSSPRREQSIIQEDLNNNSDAQNSTVEDANISDVDVEDDFDGGRERATSTHCSLEDQNNNSVDGDVQSRFKQPEAGGSGSNEYNDVETRSDLSLQHEERVRKSQSKRRVGRRRSAGSNLAASPTDPPRDEDSDSETETENVYSLDQGSILAIADEVIGRFANKVELNQVGSLSKLIARKIVDEQENLKRREKAKSEIDLEWLEDEENNYLICVACLHHTSSGNVPPHLKTYNRGHFGFLDRHGGLNYDKTRAIKRHIANPLHLWCAVQESKLKEKTEEVAKKNKVAAEMVASNALYVLKDPTGSAQDFLKLNNKDELNDQLNWADKNDGKNMYFQIRNIVFDHLSGKLKEIIKSVETLGCTLDKVTVGGTSYTCILTYFFWGGQIKTVMNELYLMRSEDLDGEGTAEMLCKSLMSTLGLSKEELAEKLEHVREGLHKHFKIKLV